MFERSFAWSMCKGPWLIVSVAAVMLLAGLIRFVSIMRSDFYHFGTNEHFFLSSVGPGVILLFGAVLTARLRRA